MMSNQAPMEWGPKEDAAFEDPVGSRRSRLDICYDILEVVWKHQEIKPTQLMYKANLSWKVMTDMVDHLGKRGLMESRVVGSRKTLALTLAGRSCLEKLHQARSAIIAEEVQRTQVFGPGEKTFVAEFDPAPVLTNRPRW